ncbi:uncharacterized protein MKZ38_007120 [Zalerion maritima]|uniref:Small ribosomal subunit protein mS29 n=1 Tax=Zalerion maritima TaxID=339359 RepID=A0AAD5RIT3_9PEZI|nr:uncharacterized protein MKZ38_007120 [Zalerion maritima]
MAPLRCWRCLPPASGALLSIRRIAAITTISTSTFQPFSTSCARNAYGKGAGDSKPRKGVHRVGGKSSPPSKKKKGIPPRLKVAPGDRRAFRKRITLSNINALPVHLETLDSKAFSSEQSVGKILALGNETLDKLRRANAFKPTQSWNMFRKPSTLVRRETVNLCSKMEKNAQENKFLRCIISGERVAGKSMVVLQALAHAYANDWIVVNIPDGGYFLSVYMLYIDSLEAGETTDRRQTLGYDLVISHLDYAPIPNSNLWSLPTTIQGLLRQISGNSDLSKHKVVKSYPNLFPNQSPNLTLHGLANSGSSNDSWAVWQALWTELTEVPGRPPILMCLDGFAHVMRMSKYRTKQFEPIHAHDLALIKTFCDLMAGKMVPVQGGAVIGALSMSNQPMVKSVEYAVQYKEAQQVLQLPEEELPKREPYCREYDERVDEVLREAEILKVGGINKKEARAIMEYWAASGMYRHKVDERRVTETWSLGGHGIIGEMERASLRNSRI